MQIFFRCWLLAISTMGWCISSIATGQVPAPSALPNLDLRSNGSVFALATDPDGGIIVGGNFTYFAGQPRHNVARLFLNGALDPDWHPDVNGIVTAIAVDDSGLDSGNVYLGGDFTQVDGAPRSRLALIGFDGALDTGWNPGADNRINTLVLSGDSLFAGGFFDSIGGTPRRFLAKLSGSGNGAVDANWDPSPSSHVYALTLDGPDKLFVGGNFSVVGSANRALVARVSTTGVGAADSFFASVCCNTVRALSVVGADLFVGGDFVIVGTVQRQNLAKVAKTSGVVDAIWNPGSNEQVTTLFWDGANHLYVGGFFAQIGGAQRQNLARLTTAGNGVVDSAWNPAPDGEVRAIVADALTGGQFIGGGFRSLGNDTRFGFAKLDSNGSATASADVERLGFVSAIALEQDGSSIVGGAFRRANGLSRENLLRARSDGNLDPTWAPSANQGVRAVAVDASGAIYAGGDFTSVSGVARSGLVKLARTGSGLPDANWNPGDNNGLILALAAADNALFAAGSFTMIGGSARTGIAKLSLSGNGSVDPNWSAAADDTVDVLLPSPASQLYIAGAFSSVGGAPRQGFARISTVGSGGVDIGWNPMPNNQVKAMSLRGDWLYVGGAFTGIGTEHFPRIARISTTGNGAADAGWNPVALSDVTAILASDDGIYVGGAFDTIGGLPNRLHLARLSSENNGAADPNWNPILNGLPHVIVDRGAQIEIGGSFNAVSNQTRIGIARLAKDSIFSDQFE